jgi:hypothetical protein
MVERCVSSRPTPSGRSGGADSSAGVIRSPCYREVLLGCQTLCRGFTPFFLIGDTMHGRIVHVLLRTAFWGAAHVAVWASSRGICKTEKRFGGLDDAAF